MKITVKLAIFTLATVALQFGLAVLGWGGFAAFFSHPPLVAVAIVTDHSTIWLNFSFRSAYGTIHPSVGSTRSKI